MASTQSKLYHLLLRLINKKKYLRKQLASGKPAFFNCPEPPPKIRETCDVHKSQINGHKVFTLSPKNKPKSENHILYLHGGAYVQCFNKFQWYFLADLIRNTGSTIIAPDYPLAPVYNYKDAYEMVTTLYNKLIATVKNDNFILMGDSSGGGLALALAQKMRDEKIRQPNHIILLSPWLDITLSNPDINNIEPADLFLEKESLQRAGKLFAGNTDTANFLLSPINSSLDGLGNITVFTGSSEILAADARKLKRLAESGGNDLTYYEYEGMMHGWMFLNLPESKETRQQVFKLVQR